MVLKFAIVLILALALSCAPDARSVRLANLDLTEMSTVEKIRAQLSPNDRIAFATFVARHGATSGKLCGGMQVSPNGDDPRTVGEAVDLTKKREAEDREALVEASRSKSPHELAREEWDDLITQKDDIIDAQSRLRAQFGMDAERQAKWAALKTRKSRLDRRLDELSRGGLWPARQG